ncbi:hypothetical protein [Mycolicibacterium insubricum]|uniref:hypothetical protein n=1 Tax=Mycolicibacterium insubricum TaxID=444597 RepID=UPI0021F2DCC1|nr:hypothetical protein [Mycolicibacterium insubricum]MCV7082932.1 hypothetical protein [Mycolicibacterium insubricum]
MHGGARRTAAQGGDLGVEVRGDADGSVERAVADLPRLLAGVEAPQRDGAGVDVVGDRGGQRLGGAAVRVGDALLLDEPPTGRLCTFPGGSMVPPR